MMLSLDTAYRSFGGEVEASSTPTICRLPDSRRHQLSAIAREPHGRGVLTLQSARYEGEFRNGKPQGNGTVTNLEGVFKGKGKEGCLVGDKRKISFAVPSST